jgi:hypothetical protein
VGELESEEAVGFTSFTFFFLQIVRSSVYTFDIGGYGWLYIVHISFLQIVRSPFCMFDIEGYDPGLSPDIYEYQNFV